MARGDGIDRTNARNMRLTATKIGNTQQHNEREKDSYVNQDIVPERSRRSMSISRPRSGRVSGDVYPNGGRWCDLHPWH